MTAEPKFFQEKRAQGRGTKRVEKRIAECLGGHRVSGSGATPETGWHGKFGKHTFAGKKEKGKVRTRDGDVSTPTLHVEHKRTKGKSISVTKEILRKVERGAVRNNADPAVVLTFEGTQGTDDWILVPLAVYNRLVAERDNENS